MQYELQLNLQYKAALSAALSFWEKKEAKDMVREFFCNYSKLGKSEARDEWHRLTKSLLTESKQHALPLRLESELTHTIKEIGKKIYHWYLYIEHENASQYRTVSNAIDYLEEICWTPHGAVDEVKVFKSFWLDNPSLNIAKLYNMACSYLLEEYINDLWTKIPKDIQENCYNDIYQCNDRHILAYWECYKDGDLHRLVEYLEIAARRFGRQRMYNLLYNRDHSIEENMLRLSVHEGYSIAAQYFWDKLSEDESDRNVLRCAHTSIMRYNDYANIDEDISHYKKEKYVEICIFLMNQMTLGHKEILFKEELIFNEDDEFLSEARDVKGEILKMLLSVWPWQKLLIPVLSDMLPYLERYSETVCIFLEAITKQMFEDAKLGYDVTSGKYRNILEEVWHNLPRSIKQKIVQENKSLDFICDLIDVCALDSIQLIFNDPEVADIRDKYIESGSSRYVKLIKNNQYELLDRFMHEIFRSDVEKKHFKQKINIWEDFIKENQYDMANKLLDWQCDTHEERKYLKSRIDHIKLCQDFIIKERYDLADKFLNWRFETAEERKEYKDHFKDDMFAIERIYKIWRECREEIDEAKERSSRFLHWFIESVDEIARFKKEKIVHAQADRLLIDYFVRSDLIEIVEAFLFWCLLSKDEVQPIKQLIGYRMGHVICENNIAMGYLAEAESFVRWAFSEVALMQSFIKKFIISDDGVASCHSFIKKASNASYDIPQVTLDGRLEKLNKLIDFWIKPLENIDEFRIKFTSHGVYFDNAVQREEHKIFIDLLANLEKNNDLTRASHIRRIAQGMNLDEKTGHSR